MAVERLPDPAEFAEQVAQGFERGEFDPKNTLESEVEQNLLQAFLDSDTFPNTSEGFVDFVDFIRRDARDWEPSPRAQYSRTITVEKLDMRAQILANYWRNKFMETDTDESAKNCSKWAMLHDIVTRPAVGFDAQRKNSK